MRDPSIAPSPQEPGIYLIRPFRVLTHIVTVLLRRDSEDVGVEWRNTYTKRRSEERRGCWPKLVGLMEPREETVVSQVFGVEAGCHGEAMVINE
jgi:hypothetical protein